MDEPIYTSEYYCDDCKCFHEVTCWMDSNEKYYVTDSDGDVIEKFETYDEILTVYPEGNPNTTPKPKQYKSEKWFAVLDPQSKNVAVTSVKKGGRWNKDWRDNGISPTDAPDEVRLTLGLSDTDKENNVIDATWEEVVKGVKSLEGAKIYKNTTVISVTVKIKIK